MSKNAVTLRGNLVSDPYFGFIDTADGQLPMMRLTLAVDRHPPRPPGTDYIQVCMYGPQAVRSFAYLQQGSLILADGWLRSREGTDSSGKKMSRLELVADEITFLHNINWERGNAATQSSEVQSE